MRKNPRNPLKTDQSQPTFDRGLRCLFTVEGHTFPSSNGNGMAVGETEGDGGMESAFRISWILSAFNAVGKTTWKTTSRDPRSFPFPVGIPSPLTTFTQFP